MPSRRTEKKNYQKYYNISKTIKYVLVVQLQNYRETKRVASLQILRSTFPCLGKHRAITVAEIAKYKRQVKFKKLEIPTLLTKLNYHKEEWILLEQAS